MKQFTDYMNVIFGPLAKAAGREDLLSKLKTSHLSPDRREAQIEKLKNLDVVPDDIVDFTGNKFAFRFNFKEKTYLCIATESLKPEDIDEMSAAMSKEGIFEEEIDESTFMFLSLNYSDVYNHKPDTLSQHSARNIVEIADEKNYDGHDIFEAINWYDKISIYSLPRDSIFASCKKWYIAAHLSTSYRSFRASNFPESTTPKLQDLLNIGNVNPEFIYYAATSLHMRQCFLEIYRCIETIFYLPWVLNLKNSYGYSADGLTIFRQLRDAIKWRQKEADSISSLFSLISEHSANREILLQAKPFADLDLNSASQEAIGRRIYKIRNILVHQEDYDDTSPLEFTPKCWTNINIYILDIVIDLYKNNRADIGFEYILK